jgi:hypothetical protein
MQVAMILPASRAATGLRNAGFAPAANLVPRKHGKTGAGFQCVNDTASVACGRHPRSALDGTATGSDHRCVQTDQRHPRMSIKPTIAAAGTVAWLLLYGPAFAEDAADAPEMQSDGQAVETVDISATAAADEPAVAPAPQPAPEPMDMAEPERPAASVILRTGAARGKGHRDARACLEAADNAAIIKCAEKYR